MLPKQRPGHQTRETTNETRRSDSRGYKRSTIGSAAGVTRDISFVSDHVLALVAAAVVTMNNFHRPVSVVVVTAGITNWLHWRAKAVIDPNVLFLAAVVAETWKLVLGVLGV